MVPIIFLVYDHLGCARPLMNLTGEYPVGNYTVEATYDIYSDETSVNMTENKQTTLRLNFIIPEFPSLIILALFMIATLLAALVYRRKHYE